MQISLHPAQSTLVADRQRSATGAWLPRGNTPLTLWNLVELTLPFLSLLLAKREKGAASPGDAQPETHALYRRNNEQRFVKMIFPIHLHLQKILLLTVALIKFYVQYVKDGFCQRNM